MKLCSSMLFLDCKESKFEALPLGKDCGKLFLAGKTAFWVHKRNIKQALSTAAQTEPKF